MECGAVPDVSRLLGTEIEAVQKARPLLERIVSMLTKMVR